MDAFVSRKKRKLSLPPLAMQAPLNSSLDLREDPSRALPEDESTDFKLALLSSMHPDTDQQLLLDILLAHEGSVEEASVSLATSDSPPRKSSSSTVIGHQSSLSSFISQEESKDPSKSAKLLSKRGKTLHLYDPADIAQVPVWRRVFFPDLNFAKQSGYN